MAKRHIVIADRFILRSPFQRKGRWVARYRDKLTGKLHERWSTCARKRAARDEIVRFLEKQAGVESGGDVKMPFAEAFEEFLQTRTCRPVTIQSYREVFHEGLHPVFGTWSIHQIQFSDVERYILARKSRGNSPRTVTIHIGLLRRFFKWAILRNYAKKDPTAGFRLAGSRTDVGRALSVDEARRLLEACRARGKQIPAAREMLYLATLMSLYTGLRQRNVYGLQWRHCDLENGWIRIPGKEMKNGSDHEIPIHRVLREHLRARRDSVDVLELSGLVLGGIKCSRFSFGRACEVAGIGHLRWHDLRHFFGSWLESRCSWALLQILMGHARQGVTSLYVHPTPAKKVEAVESFPDLTLPPEPDAPATEDEKARGGV